MIRFVDLDVTSIGYPAIAGSSPEERELVARVMSRVTEQLVAVNRAEDFTITIRVRHRGRELAPMCEHVWSSPEIGAAPCRCVVCGLPKVAPSEGESVS